MTDLNPILIFAGLLAGVLLGMFLGTSLSNRDFIEDCRKQHNVYECVVIAIPKGKEGIYK